MITTLSLLRHSNRPSTSSGCLRMLSTHTQAPVMTKTTMVPASNPGQQFEFPIIQVTNIPKFKSVVYFWTGHMKQVFGMSVSSRSIITVRTWSSSSAQDRPSASCPGRWKQPASSDHPCGLSFCSGTNLGSWTGEGYQRSPSGSQARLRTARRPWIRFR